MKSAKLTCRPAERLRTRSSSRKRAAIDVVRRDDMRAAVEQFETPCAIAARPEREGEGGRAAFQVGDGALEGEARRVLAAGIFEPLVHAGALLAIGRGGVDRHHHRAGGRVDGSGRHGWCGSRRPGGS